MRLMLANPRGFCAGVDRAVRIVDLALEVYGPPIYVRKEIVHNRHVVKGFEARGVIFVGELEDVPEGAHTILSAHGVAPAVFERAKQRSLNVIDATCPLVTKVHLEAHRFVREGYHIILIGHEGHDEVVGTMGQAAGHVTLWRAAHAWLAGQLLILGRARVKLTDLGRRHVLQSPSSASSFTIDPQSVELPGELP